MRLNYRDYARATRTGDKTLQQQLAQPRPSPRRAFENISRSPKRYKFDQLESATDGGGKQKTGSGRGPVDSELNLRREGTGKGACTQTAQNPGGPAVVEGEMRTPGEEGDENRRLCKLGLFGSDACTCQQL
uniref:Uncharacterized protein n=1 Tax=Steinernema glaseri TaxID=37863 RepID=A0A1I8A2Q8_9BILA